MSSSSSPTPSRRITLLAYPDCQVLDVCGPWQVFASANDVLGKPAQVRLDGDRLVIEALKP